MSVHSFAEAKAARRKVSPDVFHCIDCASKGEMIELQPVKRWGAAEPIWWCHSCGRED